ncbi:MAG: branched-chain amino acid ABC transporter permease [Candidatus Thorarchaeota archaeon]|nr:branched-chain amino acid ABC transporter permease [Candidatus Thorarchaeota archaeon]
MTSMERLRSEVEGIKKIPREKLLLFVALAAALLVIPNFLGVYQVHILNVILYYIIIASAWNLLAGYTGIFSLAQAALSATGAYTTGLLSYHLGINPIVGILLGGVLAAFVSYAIGSLTLNMRGIYLALATWAFAGSAKIFISINYEVTRGELGLTVQYLYGVIPGIAPMMYYYTTLALTAVALLAIYKIINSRMGLFLKAIREDSIAAEVAGVDTVKYKKRIFILVGFIAGIFGAYYAHYLGIISPSLFAFEEMAIIIIMTIVGGYGYFYGPVLGAITIEVLSEYLREFGEIRMVLYGIIVLVMMRTFKDGLCGIAQSIHDKWKSSSMEETVQPAGGNNG